MRLCTGLTKSADPGREIAAAGLERAKARERLRTGAAVRRCAAGGFPAARRNTQAPDGAPGPSLYAREKKQCLGRAKARVRGRWRVAERRTDEMRLFAELKCVLVMPALVAGIHVFAEEK